MTRHILNLKIKFKNISLSQLRKISNVACLRETEMAILRRTERAMVRSKCGVKLVDRKMMEDLMEMLGLKETLDRMAKANGVKWYGHVIRRDDNILKKALMMDVNGKQKRGRPKLAWMRQVEESMKKVGLKIKKAGDRTRWRESVRAIAEGMRCTRPPSGTRKKPDLKLDRRTTRRRLTLPKYMKIYSNQLIGNQYSVSRCKRPFSNP